MLCLILLISILCFINQISLNVASFAHRLSRRILHLLFVSLSNKNYYMDLNTCFRHLYVYKSMYLYFYTDIYVLIFYLKAKNHFRQRDVVRNLLMLCESHVRYIKLVWSRSAFKIAHMEAKSIISPKCKSNEKFLQDYFTNM